MKIWSRQRTFGLMLAVIALLSIALLASPLGVWALETERSSEATGGQAEASPLTTTEPSISEVEQGDVSQETEGPDLNPGAPEEEVEQTRPLETAEPQLEVAPSQTQTAVQSGNPSGVKAITLYKDGTKDADFDTLQEVLDKMYDYAKGGDRYQFVIEVNQDLELTQFNQFGFPYGEVTLKSKDPANPVTIKSNQVNHSYMLGVVNGAKVTVENIMIDGNNERGLFWVESTEGIPAHLTIGTGAVLQNGKAEIGGGIFCQYAGYVTVEGGIIRNNEATRAGGGICYIATKTLTINGGDIYGNKVPKPGFGGGIALQGKGLIKGGKIHDNTAYNGGGIASGTGANLEIAGGAISGNAASNAGGGVYLFSDSVVKLSGGQVSGNTAPYGGGVTAVYDSNFIMDGNGVISANQARNGGGLYMWGTTPACDLISGTIEGNKARFGGGIRVRSAHSKIGAVVIRENTADFGGGIYSSIPEGESITIDGVQLIQNEALSGGGICLPQGGKLHIKNAQFTENKAYYGGGIWTSRAMTIEKSTFKANAALKSEPAILPDGTHENNGHGGAIYVNTALADDGVVTIDGSSFLQNKADKSGGAISIDETHGLVKIVNGTLFDGNEATGELGHGGAIYSNLHAYEPEYDDGSVGPLVQPPTPKDYYYNINTDATTVFKNNKAFQTFTPPSTKDEFVKLLYAETSHPGTKYDHPLNNDDINLIVFCHVIFDKNYETDKPIHAAFLLLEKSKLGEEFPEDPKREGYIFKGWNTQRDGKGTAFTKDTVVESDITLYAIYEMKATIINAAPELKLENKTILKGDALDLMSLIVKASDQEDGDLTDKVMLLDAGGFDPNKLGEYLVSFAVTDSKGATTRAKAKVIVKEKTIPTTTTQPTVTEQTNTTSSEKPETSKTIVSQKPEKQVPKTGASPNTGLYLALLGLAGAFLTLRLTKKEASES